MVVKVKSLWERVFHTIQTPPHTYKERASEASSLLVRVWRCLNGMEDIIIMHCTVPRALIILYCTCSDLQFMFIPLASLY